MQSGKQAKNIGGNIFDVQQFSVHDGVGIRTTVFLKGCPLGCVWCQNPEGINPKPQIVWLQNKCMYCGCCINEAGAALSWQGNVLHINTEKANNWSAPLYACPTAALRWDASWLQAEELLNILQKDEVFFKHGGGVTFSGGEPLMQANFLHTMLCACKKKGWHTAIETSLHAPWEDISMQLDVTDTIFADFKIYNDEQHKKCTGVSNQLIIDNLTKLLQGQHKQKVVIRTPLIPKLSAKKQNIASIASFISGLYNDVAYELLNFNPLAAGKYLASGKTYCFGDVPIAFSKEQMQEFYETALESGVRRLVQE